MAKLIGNYTVPGQTGSAPTPPADSGKNEDTVMEFERRAMARLGGSIAFVMKGKSVLWTGEPPKDGSGRT